MSWAKLDDQFFYNKKIAQVDGPAKLLYIAGLVYVANQLTDGFIPERAVKFIASTADIASCQDFANQLLDVGLWETTDGGYLIHDYLEWNPSSEQVEATRAARKLAGSRGGYAKAAKSSKSLANCQPVAKQNPSKSLANIQQKSAPSPSPSPKEEPPSFPEDKTPVFAPMVSNGNGRKAAEKMQALNRRFGPELRTPLADYVLKITGQYDLAETEMGEGLRVEAHEAADALLTMNYRTEEDLMRIEDDWCSTWPGSLGGRPTLKQFMTQASLFKAGKRAAPAPQAAEVYR